MRSFSATTSTITDSIFIEKIQGKVADREVQQTYDFILKNLPLFLTDEDYEIIQQRISKDSVQSSIEGVYKSLK